MLQGADNRERVKAEVFLYRLLDTKWEIIKFDVLSTNTNQKVEQYCNWLKGFTLK